jgi:hypothetical protein
MKKIIFFTILSIACATIVYAQSETEPRQNLQIKKEVIDINNLTEPLDTNNYQKVLVGDLSEVVQGAIRNIENDTLKLIKTEFHEQLEFTKVYFLEKKSQNEKIVILNNIGQEVLIKKEVIDENVITTSLFPYFSPNFLPALKIQQHPSPCGTTCRG